MDRIPRELVDQLEAGDTIVITANQLEFGLKFWPAAIPIRLEKQIDGSWSVKRLDLQQENVLKSRISRAMGLIDSDYSYDRIEGKEDQLTVEATDRIYRILEGSDT